MSAITIEGDLVHYEKLGRGRPVILVHGWVGSWRYWIPLMQQLHVKYSVYTLDLMGFGDSAKNTGRYAVDQQVNMIFRFMEQLAIPKAAMLGHGLGALVLARFAIFHPDKVARLLLISPPLFDSGDLKERTPAGTRVALTRTTVPAPVAAPLRPLMPSFLSQPLPMDVLGDDADMTIPSRTRLIPGDVTVPNRSSLADSEPNFERAPMPPAEPTINRTSLMPLVGPLNPLADLFTGKNLLTLLERCFKRNDPIFEKLRADVERTDEQALTISAQNFSSGTFLDDIRGIAAPTVVVHGMDDPIIPVPTDDIWQYLTVDRDELFVPIPIAGVRHFPMLEYEPFVRLATDFLDIPDISKIEVRGRWIRRSR